MSHLQGVAMKIHHRPSHWVAVALVLAALLLALNEAHGQSAGAAAEKALQARGHSVKKINDPYMDFGSGQFIWRLTDDMEDGYVAASDSRRDGAAVGY